MGPIPLSRLQFDSRDDDMPSSQKECKMYSYIASYVAR